jgi:crotonobetainyl-CoA:carnitine CoA-transferase CaiB-like acyl-CoA transferase
MGEGRDSLVFASVTGFGLSGERSGLACYDLIAEGYSGIMDITGAADSAPQKIGAPAADMLAGQDAAMAVIAALFQRQRSGTGAKIDVSLVESIHAAALPHGTAYYRPAHSPYVLGSMTAWMPTVR